MPSSSRAVTPEVRTLVDDSYRSNGGARIRYYGHWEHASNHADGRTLGTSSRSFHAGDRFVVDFAGTRIRVYGVRGWKGGYGTVRLDHRPIAARPDFYAPVMQPNALVYESPALAAGRHTLSVMVTGRRQPASKGAYVNIDDVAITSTGSRAL